MQVLPLFFPVTYLYLLPAWESFQSVEYSRLGADDAEAAEVMFDEDEPDIRDTSTKPLNDVYLTPAEKWALFRPLVLRYMAPLFFVYVEEYLINSGVAPTLVFPMPTSGLWSLLFKKPRDYYPFWSLTCGYHNNAVLTRKTRHSCSSRAHRCRWVFLRSRRSTCHFRPSSSSSSSCS